jgi:hypothetical protein
MLLVCPMEQRSQPSDADTSHDGIHRPWLCHHGHYSESSMRVSMLLDLRRSAVDNRFSMNSPSPPSPALSQRLLEAANAAGGNLQKASSSVQVLLSDAARSIGLGSGSSTSSFGSDLDVSSLLKALRLPDREALAARLGVSRYDTKTFVSTLDKYQNRAQAWKENNVSVLGWTGAVLGSASAYAFMFGVVGLIGLLSPKNAKVKG